MDKLGVWLNLAWKHLQEHWRDHLLPAVAMFGIVFGMTFIGIFVVSAGIIIGAMADSEELTLVLVFGLGFLFSIVFMIAYIPLVVGYMKGTLKLMRGGELVVGDLFSGLRETPAALITMTITMTCSMFAALFFYFPALIVSTFLWFALPLVADGVGPIDALKKSVEMVKPQFWGLLVYQFIFGFIMAMLAYIPLVGPLLMFPIMFVMMMVPYVDLLKEAQGDDDDAPFDEI